VPAGDYSAGDLDLAGEDPVASPSAPRNVTPPQALLFDGATRTFLFDDNGLLRSVHPVDQKVELGLLLELGKIAPVPTIGTAFRSIKYIDPQKIDNQVRDAIRLAIGSLKTNGDIEEINVTVLRPNRNAFSVQFTYRNLRLPNDQRRTLTLSTGRV
jgi:hypothetical protein